MKRLTKLVALALIAALAGALIVSQSRAQRDYGRHHGRGALEYGQGGDWNYCPYCGGSIRGRDYSDRQRNYRRHYDSPGRGGYGMGPGMMQPGYGRMGPEHYRPYDAPGDRRYRGPGEPLEKEEAGERVEDMLRRSGNPHLEVGAIEDGGEYFIVEVLTESGSLTDKIEVDKGTGRMRSRY